MHWQLLLSAFKSVFGSCGWVGCSKILQCRKVLHRPETRWPTIDENTLKLSWKSAFKTQNSLKTRMMKMCRICPTVLCIVYLCSVENFGTTKALSSDEHSYINPTTVALPSCTHRLKPAENFPRVSRSERPFDAETVQTHIFHQEIANEVHASKAVSFVTQWSIHRSSQ